VYKLRIANVKKKVKKPVASPSMGHWARAPLDSASLWIVHAYKLPITITACATSGLISSTSTHEREGKLTGGSMFPYC